MDFFEEYDNSNNKVIDALKMALYKKTENIFEILDFGDDNIFSDPFFYACINNRDYSFWINLLLFAFSKEENIDKTEFCILKEGVIYIPQYGYLRPSPIKEKEIFIQKTDNQILLFNKENESIDFEIEPLLVNKYGIEFLEYNHPLVESFFTFERKIDTSIKIDKKINQKHINYFNTALEVIKEMYPEYFELVKKYLKKVVFYEGKANSFASIQAQGMIFLNVRDEYNEVFYLDNILHQCAHVFFNVLTFEKQSLFKIPFDLDLSVISNDPIDKGHKIYNRFHGLFTQTNINICMEKCIEKDIFESDRKHELLGRFSSNMKRFKTATYMFDKDNLYTDEGALWFNFFKNVFLTIYNRNKEIIEKYNVSNQPYVFDYKVFKETNSAKLL